MTSSISSSAVVLSRPTRLDCQLGIPPEQPRGSLVDKAGFLKQIAPPAKIKGLACEDVNVRVMGDFAVIHARTTYSLLDGRAGNGRYTDIWAKRNGRWLCVEAQVARS